jgi:hypothetical protein
MAITATQLLTELRAGTSETDRAERAVSEATLRVDAYVARALIDEAVPVPASALDEAYLAAAVDWFNRTKAPNGALMQQLDNGADGSAVALRPNRDPLASARPLLNEWCFEAGMA